MRSTDGAAQGRSPGIHTAAVGCARERRGGSAGRETSSLAVHAAIPPVLDSIITAVAQSACNLCPTLAHLIHHVFNHQTLVSRNGLAVQRGFEVLVESLPTLLGRAVVHVLGDTHPVVGALIAHQLDEQLVLFRYPGSSTVSMDHCCCRYREGRCLKMSEEERNRGGLEEIIIECWM